MGPGAGLYPADAPLEHDPDRSASFLPGAGLHHREIAAQIPKTHRLRGGSVFLNSVPARPHAVLAFVLMAGLTWPALEGGGTADAQAVVEHTMGVARAAAGAPRATTTRRGAATPRRSSRPGVAPPFFTGRPNAAAYRTRSEAELKLAQAAIDRMLAVRGARTIPNTVLVYNEATTHGENVAYQANLLEAVHPDSTFRVEAEAVSQTANKFLDDLNLNRKVYDALVSVDVSKADPATQYFMMRTLRDFRRAGVDKDEATRQRIAGIYEELVKTSQDFDRNIRNDSRKIHVLPA